MCGIVVAIGAADDGTVDEALLKIKHRGQDASQCLSVKGFQIGFNRLAINDKTENGMQPFKFGSLIGVFNGEIYNAQALRETFNIQTTSRADTVVILPLFTKLGSAIIHYLDGFYSGVIYNEETRQLFLLRDHIGKKPLFYAEAKGKRFIVSELKALSSINAFEIIPKGFSLLSNGKIQNLEQHQDSFVTETSLRSKLANAVCKRIPKGEKRFGVFLSGGLDSSIIACLVAKQASNVIYYTLGNEADLSFVDVLSDYLGIKNQVKKVNLPSESELPSLIRKVVYHTESYNPSIISNGLATYLLSLKAHTDGLKVVLSGEGADELFCGYRISQDVQKWFEKREELIHYMHLTELRRLDLASMAHTIEVRCPFLDRQVYATSNRCKLEELIEGGEGKKLLRASFKEDLPTEIIERKKMSFDVGSGIRKLVVEYLTASGKTETERLKEIWSDFFEPDMANEPYFHSYPTFNTAIRKRGIKHKS